MARAAKEKVPKAAKGPGAYKSVIGKIFTDRYNAGATEVPFNRTAIIDTGNALDVKLPKNAGDVPYYFRYRYELPDAITETQPEGREWIIEGAGRSKYCFRLVRANRIRPNEALISVKVPDATPEIITAYALSDEQALLAKVRYNRLIDLFLGISCYSLQNHLRTTVKGIGQIEIDEVYVGVDSRGRQYIMPVQAKGGRDQHSVVQTRQDLAYCAQRFPQLICRAISAQFMSDDRIAMFELTMEEDLLQIVEERHYRLVGASEITADDLAGYRNRA
jgi:hypothetical protein